MAHLRTHQTRAATWGFGAAFVGVDPFAAHWDVSRSRPCLCWDGILAHLPRPQLLYFFLTANVDLVRIQRSSLDIVLRFPLTLRFLPPRQPQEYPASAETDNVRFLSDTQVWL